MATGIHGNGTDFFFLSILRNFFRKQFYFHTIYASACLGHPDLEPVTDYSTRPDWIPP